MRFLVLAVVILSVFYTAQGKTVDECKAAAQRCKQFIAPLARSSGGTKEGFIRAIRTTPLDDICRAAKAFLQCGGQVMDDPECNVHEQVTKYAPLRERLQKGVAFVCDQNKEAIQAAIPCVTTRQFSHKVQQCKKNNACNSNESWTCVGNAVRQQCSSATYNFFDSNYKKFQANHPGCGDNNMMKQLYTAMKN